jgi:ferric-dicitrate binding protein FerR (iron transport regulator)
MDPVYEKNIDSIVLRLMEDEEITPEEASLLKQWIKDNPEKSRELQELSVLWTRFDAERESDRDVINKKWKETESIIKRSGLSFNHIIRNFRKYAAVFLIGMLLPSLVIGYSVLNREKLLSQVIKVPYGAKSNLMLPDGTEIIMNAGSTLSYDASYGIKERKVNLTGEAYFKVAKNKHKLFFVKTKDMTVKAYGTEFNVKCYKEDRSTEATLIEGVIGIKLNNRSNKEYILKPDQQLKYSVSEDNSGKGNLIILKNINTKFYTSWVDDIIKVKSITLKALALKLERKYNVTIHIEDKELENMKFTGVLENETIEQILQALELSASIQYKIDNREIWLYK